MLLLLMLQFGIASSAAMFLTNNKKDYDYSQDNRNLLEPKVNAGLASPEEVELYEELGIYICI